MLLEIICRNAVHAENLDFDVGSIRERVGHLVDGLLVNLHAVNGQSGTRVEFLVADVAFEMLCLLMLNKDFLVVKFAVAIPRNGSESRNNYATPSSAEG